MFNYRHPDPPPRVEGGVGPPVLDTVSGSSGGSAGSSGSAGSGDCPKVGFRFDETLLCPPEACPNIIVLYYYSIIVLYYYSIIFGRNIQKTQNTPFQDFGFLVGSGNGKVKNSLLMKAFVCDNSRFLYYQGMPEQIR